MRFRYGLALGIFIGLVSSTTASLRAEESLGEIAEREKQRRKGGSKTFSDEDLAKGKPAPTPTPEGGAPPTSGAQATTTTEPRQPTPTPDPYAVAPDPERNEGIWRGRAAGARGSVKAAQQRVADAQARLDKLKTPYKWPPTIPDPTDLANAEAELQAARDKVAKAEQDLADFEDEARRKSIPAGWTRE